MARTCSFSLNKSNCRFHLSTRVIDEDALDAGIVAQAALDVFTKEPPAADNKLVLHENVTATPHVVSFHFYVQVLSELKPYVVLAEKLGRLAVQLVAGGSSVKTVKRGLRISEERIVPDGSPESPLDFIQVLDCECGIQICLCNISLGRLRSRDRQVDQPGMIGTVGSILGEDNVNFSFMSLGRIAPRKQAVMAIGVDDQPSKEALKKIGEVSAIEEFLFLKL
uniref:D-isomer specific 2-hydroxyacid dehydrogenase NAD-binding domain-containing protein n=1 Tax=Quercus lobata TaxID=97700 RepID=A0A7N2MYS0_QUELO